MEKKVIGFYEYISHLYDFLGKSSDITTKLSELKNSIGERLKVDDYKEDEEVTAFKYYCNNLLEKRHMTEKSTWGSASNTERDSSIKRCYQTQIKKAHKVIKVVICNYLLLFK